MSVLAKTFGWDSRWLLRSFVREVGPTVRTLTVDDGHLRITRRTEVAVAGWVAHVPSWDAQTDERTADRGGAT
jgi:hypothetical protein